jgi:hypothetical protein
MEIKTQRLLIRDNGVRTVDDAKKDIQEKVFAPLKDMGTIKYDQSIDDVRLFTLK